MYNNITVMNKCYQLGIHKIHFGHNKSQFNSILHYKTHLTYVSMLCVKTLEGIIIFRFFFEIYKLI